MSRLLLRILCVVISLDVTISGGGSGCRCDCGCEPEIYKRSRSGSQYIATPSNPSPEPTTPSPLSTESSVTSPPAPTCSPDCETVGNRCYKLIDGGSLLNITTYEHHVEGCAALLCGGTPAIFDDVTEKNSFVQWVGGKNLPQSVIGNEKNFTFVRLGGISDVNDLRAVFITPQGRNYTGLSEFVTHFPITPPICVILDYKSGDTPEEHKLLKFLCEMRNDHFFAACEFGRE